MSTRSRWPARFAYGLLVLQFVLMVVAFWLEKLSPPVGQPLSEAMGLYLSFVACGVLGAFLAARRPRNGIGWSFLAIGALASVMAFSLYYAYYGMLTAPGSVPFAGLATWFQTWTWTALTGAFFYVLLVFPNGEPLSRRWRPVGWLLATAIALVGVAEQLRPQWHIGQTDWGLAVDNPFPLVSEPTADAISAIGFPLALAAMVLSVVSIVLRYRRSRGVERLQLKWVAYGALVMFSGVALLETLPVPIFVANLSAVQFAVLPLTAAIAITRYRLYEIDRIVSRTVTYATVAVVLALIYGFGVVGIGRALVDLSGASHDLVVAASTLAVAAAFGPLRSRVQGIVDRRFNRARYDGERVVADFAARLRDQIDLDALGHELTSVASNTVHPTAASLWWAPREEPRP